MWQFVVLIGDNQKGSPMEAGVEYHSVICTLAQRLDLQPAQAMPENLHVYLRSSIVLISD